MADETKPAEISDEKRLIKKRRARTLAYFKDPETIEVICSHVANGGTVVSLAKDWDIRYSDITRWLHGEPARSKMYSQALNDRNEWAMEAVLHELRTIALVDIRKIYDDDGNLLPVSSWPDDVAKAIAGVEVFEEWAGRGDDREQIGVTKKIKIADKLKALELAGKNLSMFTEKEVEDRIMRLEDLVMASYQKDVSPALPHPKDDKGES